MLEITQSVNNNNIDAIMARYLELGWGFKYTHYCGDQALSVTLVWPYESPPKFPKLGDLW